MINKVAKHLFIPDVQAKDGVSLDHLTHIGKYIVEKKPDVIVCIGDFADMPSLSSYDKGTKSFEGRRYKKDIAAARKAMDLLLEPIKAYNAHMRTIRQKQYKPRMVLTLGNHEERIMRAVNNSAELDGVIGYHDLPYEDWEVIDYLKPIFIDGVCYTHFMANPMTGRPYGGTAATILKQVGHSFVVGHAQKLEVATRHILTGGHLVNLGLREDPYAGKIDGAVVSQQWGIVAGACYQHDEDYKGYQGNNHWRGIIMLHRVIAGSFDPCFISLDYLKDKYNG